MNTSSKTSTVKIEWTNLTLRTIIKQKLSRQSLDTKLIDKVIRYDNFNRVQMESFPSILNNNNNILINSPTGSGKTFIFEIAILKLLLSNIEKQKIIYVAPTKSLCHEIFLSWSKLFAPISVIELNSDYLFSFEEEQNEITKGTIIITTPEKFDLIIKKWRINKFLLEKLSLLIIDELHLLDD